MRCHPRWQSPHPDLPRRLTPCYPCSEAPLPPSPSPASPPARPRLRAPHATPSRRSSPVSTHGSTARRLRCRNCAARSCSSISGPTRASTASTRCRTCSSGIRSTRIRGWSSSACTRRNMRSSATPAMCVMPFAALASRTRWRKTIAMQPGKPTTTCTGRASTSSTRREDRLHALRRRRLRQDRGGHQGATQRGAVSRAAPMVRRRVPRLSSPRLGTWRRSSAPDRPV